MRKIILAKPVDHFEALCNELRPLQLAQEQQQKRQAAREHNVVMAKCHSAHAAGLMSAMSINRLDLMMRNGVELSPEILRAIENLPTPGVTK
jgi:hypothetical protein